jgi:deoxyribose-phosphate aldolase
MSSAAYIASFIDHTLLKPEAGPEQIRRLCEEARRWAFAAVCVNPVWVPLAADLLAGSGVRVASVCGFPLGANPTAVKVFEAGEALREGAAEIDMVMSIGDAKAGRWGRVMEDVAAVAQRVHEADGVLKVILECGLLTDTEKEQAARNAVRAGADFVKTSTGFLAGGATVEDVALLRRVVGTAVGVKAAGGIRTLGQARAMLAAGASRLGTSSGVRIVEEAAAGEHG